MIPFFEPIDFQKNFDLFYKFRKSAHIDITGSFPHSEDTIKSYVNKNITTFGKDAFLHMILEDEIIGQLEMGEKDNNGYVYFFYIVPSFRSKGYFKFMHEKMLSVMRKKQRFEYVMLSTALGHETAINIYKKYGWTYFGENKKKKA